MKIELNSIDLLDEGILLLDFVDKLPSGLFLSTKLQNKKMYGEKPQKIFPLNVVESKIYFDISSVSSRYPLRFEIKSDVDFELGNRAIGKEIEKIESSPVQFKVNYSKEKEFYGGKVDVEGEMFYGGKNKLLAMKRVKQQFSYEHYPEISDISVIDGMIDLLPEKIIKDLNLADRDILDIFEEDSIGRRFPLKIDGILPNKWTTISSTDDQIIIYKTKLGNLGLRFAIKNRLNISAISCKDSQIICSLSHEININELYLSNATKSGEISDKRVIKKINFKQFKNNLIFDVNELLSNPESQFQKSFCLIYKEPSGNLLRTIKYVDNVLVSSDSYLDLNVGKNFLDEAVVSIRMVQTKNPIKVAVLGSSHTRPMFTSTDYFNPDYKQFFKVVYTQFHSSIRSLVDERKIVYPKEYFEKEHPTAQGYIKTDFQKDFFDKLSESNAEVLLIDIYIDVQMGVFELSNGILSYNTYQAKNEYIAELDDEINLSTIENDAEYINKFKLSLELFKKKLLKIFPENRIIIHSQIVK